MDLLETVHGGSQGYSRLPGGQCQFYFACSVFNAPLISPSPPLWIPTWYLSPAVDVNVPSLPGAPPPFGQDRLHNLQHSLGQQSLGLSSRLLKSIKPH